MLDIATVKNLKPHLAINITQNNMTIKRGKKIAQHQVTGRIYYASDIVKQTKMWLRIKPSTGTSSYRLATKHVKFF